MSECYYHGLLPREDVQYLLKNNGDFLVRVSQPRSNDVGRQIIISLLVDKDAETNIGLRHIVVRKQMGKYQVEESPRFDLIQHLIDHFMKSGKPISPTVGNTVLVTPIGRQKWELRHSDIELTKRLGAGVYGEVYRGKMKRRNHMMDIAVKTARTTVVTKEGIKEMMREARMMRNYIHPNVVRIYGVALDEDPIMIVMELVRGGSLQEHLRSNSAKITDTERLNSMASSASWGLEFLHSRSCIHRDIASRNCLYDRSKNVKISDFGLSREGETFKMTTTQRVPIKWIAPETLTTFTFSKATDVYSFGVLIWEIYNNGIEPFEGKKTSEIKAMVLNGERLEFPSTTPPEIKEMVTQHMWNKAEERYTMIDIVKRFEQLSGVKQPPPKQRNNKGSLKTIGRITADESNVSMETSSKGSWSTKKLKKRRSKFLFRSK
uniref:Tyrosine-protein kinase n=1 Tax=Panagrolaimus superbus TaxID=310955 RepID=A0A914Z5H0_9BILA